MVSGSEGDQVSIVGGRRDRDGSSASNVGVAQLVRKVLKNVRSVTVVVVKHVVVSRSRCSLDKTSKNCKKIFSSSDLDFLIVNVFL